MRRRRLCYFANQDQMIAEFLVIYTCSKSIGCNETSTAYYVTHPDFKQFVQKSEENIKRYAGPIITNYFGPMIYYVMGSTAIVRLSDNFNLQINQQNNTIIFHREF